MCIAKLIQVEIQPIGSGENKNNKPLQNTFELVEELRVNSGAGQERIVLNYFKPKAKEWSVMFLIGQFDTAHLAKKNNRNDYVFSLKTVR